VNNEDYTQLGHFVKHVNESSFNSFGKSNPESTLFDDDFMNAILDKNKIVKIGDWFIKINPETEKVLALSSTEESAYEGLLLETSRDIKIFATEDDVIYHLSTNTTPEDRSCGGIGSGTYNSALVTHSSTGINFRSFVKFSKYGVFFVLKAGYESDAVAGTNFNKYLEIKGPKAWRKRRPCNSNATGTHAAGSLGNKTANYYEYVFYQNVRNLNGYYFYVRANWEGQFTNWTGRNINSPY